MFGCGRIRVAVGSARDQSSRHPFGAFCIRGGTFQQEGRRTSIASGTDSSSSCFYCAATRANYLLRVVKPEATTSHAQRHNASLWKCLCEILHVDLDLSADLRETVSLPLFLGGMGLRDVCRVATSAYWASWADSMPMIFQRHLDVEAGESQPECHGV